MPAVEPVHRLRLGVDLDACILSRGFVDQVDGLVGEDCGR